jgi:pyruvate dehydrogenase E1 component alpha subunit
MAAEPKNKLDPELLKSVYKEMLFYRRFEERVNQAYQKGKFAGFCHLHIGQEAVCVGVQRNLRPTDYMISGYRSHTQAMAKGIDPKAVMAELFGKVDGCAGGKGGSMHMFSKEKRFLGGHGIVGGQCPIAAGAGFTIRYNKADDIMVCYLGDGASNQGQFFEALNLAATWELPVLYIIENNQYGMGTDFRRVTSVDRLSKRAKAFDMDNSECDGMDVIKVYEHVGQIVAKMRKKPKPYLLEVLTYRYRGHSVSDPAAYRTKEEVAKFQDRDPLIQLSDLMKKNKFTDDDTLKTWDKEVKQRVTEIEDFADNSPKPPVEDAWRHVFADS